MQYDMRVDILLYTTQKFQVDMPLSRQLFILFWYGVARDSMICVWLCSSNSHFEDLKSLLVISWWITWLDKRNFKRITRVPHYIQLGSKEENSFEMVQKAKNNWKRQPIGTCLKHAEDQQSGGFLATICSNISLNWMLDSQWNVWLYVPWSWVVCQRPPWPQVQPPDSSPASYRSCWTDTCSHWHPPPAGYVWDRHDLLPPG